MPPIVFRPRGGVITAVATIVLCAVGLVFIAVTDGIPAVFTWGWPIVAIAWLAWLLYIRPSVTVTDGFVEIDNILRRHRVPWGDIVDVETRFALSVRTARGLVRAWAAPAPGARQALTTRRADVARAPGEGDTRRPSDAAGTASGDAAELVRRHWDRYRREGGVDLAGGTDSRWHVVLIVVTVTLVALSTWGLIQAGAQG